MSKMNNEKSDLKKRKLSLNRETLRMLSGEQLEEVAGGATTQSIILCLTGAFCETS